MIICGFCLAIATKNSKSKTQSNDFQGVFVQIIIIHTLELYTFLLLYVVACWPFIWSPRKRSQTKQIRSESIKERITCEYNNNKKAMVKVGVYLLEHTTNSAPKIKYFITNPFVRFYMVITNCIEMKWFFVVTVILVCSCSLCVDNVWSLFCCLYLKFGPIITISSTSSTISKSKALQLNKNIK